MFALHRRIDVMICIAAFLLAIVLAIYIVNSCRAMRNIDEIIQNPTFVGEVVRKGTTVEQTALAGAGSAMHLLHIVGEFFNGCEKILVDHVFIVPAEMFHRFRIGDTVSYCVFFGCRGFCGPAITMQL